MAASDASLGLVEVTSLVNLASDKTEICNSTDSCPENYECVGGDLFDTCICQEGYDQTAEGLCVGSLLQCNLRMCGYGTHQDTCYHDGCRCRPGFIDKHALAMHPDVDICTEYCNSKDSCPENYDCVEGDPDDTCICHKGYDQTPEGLCVGSSLQCNLRMCGYGTHQDTCYHDDCRCRPGFIDKHALAMHPDVDICTEYCNSKDSCPENYDCVEGDPDDTCICHKGYDQTPEGLCVAGETSVGLYVGVSCGVLVFISSIILALIILRRRRKAETSREGNVTFSQRNAEENFQSTNPYEAVDPEFEGPDLIVHHHVKNKVSAENVENCLNNSAEMTSRISAEGSNNNMLLSNPSQAFSVKPEFAIGTGESEVEDVYSAPYENDPSLNYNDVYSRLDNSNLNIDDQNVYNALYTVHADITGTDEISNVNE